MQLVNFLLRRNKIKVNTACNMSTPEVETVLSSISAASAAPVQGFQKAEVASPAKRSWLPSVLEFEDYRFFLREWFQSKKAMAPSFSGAVFAKRAGLSSHSLLSMVIRGERNLSPSTIRSFSRALDLNHREAQYFEKLVFFGQAKNSDDKVYYLEQLLSLSQGSGKEQLTKIQNHATYLSHWYIVAVRELVSTVGFRPDPDWISLRLKRKITRKQAEEAWKILLELKLVEFDTESKRYRAVHPRLVIDPGTVDFAVRGFHKEFLNRAQEAIEGDRLDDRELSSVTIAVLEKDLGRLREKVRDFRKSLNLEFSKGSDTPTDQVVAVNTQVLVLTQSQTSQGEKEKKE